MMNKTKIALLASVLLLVVITGYLWQAGLLSPKAGPPAGPLEKITIGTNFNELSGLLFITQDQGYAKAYGLELDLKPYQAGRDAILDLKAGRLDLACGAEFVLVSEVLAGATDLRCLATLGSGEVNELIARRDRSINRPEDLRGKTIGVPRGTNLEYFLGRFLTFNHLSLKEVTVVNLNPFDLADALAAGSVDAVIIWEPITFEIVRKIGPNAIAWAPQGGQDYYRLLVGREEVIKKKSAALEKLMRALMQAANFVKEKPEAAGEIIAQRLQVSKADYDAGKSSRRYGLLLDQGLILTMEDEARWLIYNKLTDQSRLPDFLDYLAAGPLAAVNPQAVSVIIPTGERRRPPTPAVSGQERP
jgi:NitT/TauT family transport system substrate-binding protein